MTEILNENKTEQSANQEQIPLDNKSVISTEFKGQEQPATVDHTGANNSPAVSGVVPTLKAPDDIKQIYGWATGNVTESISDFAKDKFYETPAFKSLKYKLDNTESGLSLVFGLQGTGKSRILYQLNGETAYLFKWSKNWKDDLWKRRHLVRSGLLWQIYTEKVKKHWQVAVNDLYAEGQGRKVRNAGDPEKVKERGDVYAMEAILGKSKCKAIKELSIKEFLKNTKISLIDMPDYSHSNANALVHDIAEIQRFWESLENRQHTHLVIAIQKELIMKAPNFFWGKCDKYTVEPLTTQQLIEAFMLSNPEALGVLDSEALRLLGDLSRGIFRRFKRYMRLTIEANQGTLPITKESVEKTITDDIVFQDLDQELADIFENEEKRRCASRILWYLRSHNDTNVKTIAEVIGISETMAQKVVQKLALYGYIQTKRGEGKEKLVSLQLSGGA